MKETKKVHLELSEILLDKIDQAIFNDGFHSRSEFIRFLIMNYTPQNGEINSDIQEKKEENEFANVNLEFGIPPEVIERLKEKARRMTEANS